MPCPANHVAALRRDEPQKIRSLRARRIELLDLAGADPRVLMDPAPRVDVMELAETGVKLVLRVFTRPADLWALRPALTEQIKRRFDQQGLIIAYPQLDVHMHASIWDRSQSKGNGE